MADPEVDETRPTATAIGQAFRLDDARGRYISFLKSAFPKGMRLDGLKIILDCAHGATYRVGPEVLGELGAELITIGVRPNGKNINYKCGSTYPEVMATLVKRHNADLGIAFDGDGDRVIMVDHQGKLVEVAVTGAKNGPDALRVADAVADSKLVKTAWFGRDLNWGRMAAAVGFSGVPVRPEKVSIALNGLPVVGKGQAVSPARMAQAAKEMERPVLRFSIDLGMGKAAEKVLTCDLTHEYVSINAEYPT